MHRFVTLMVAWTLLFLTGCAASARPPAAALASASASQAKLAAAKEASHILTLRAEAGEKLTAEFVELRLVWWQRWRDAEVELATDAAGRLAACRAHFKRVDEWRSLVRTRVLDAFYTYTIVDYYYGEALQTLEAHGGHADAVGDTGQAR